MVGGVSGLIGLEHLGFFSLFLISCVCMVFYKNMIKKDEVVITSSGGILKSC